ncbi:MAG: 16S rRNA (adenine(1518)-N(6)/adenine(1519)-N(6))-dimethyltransferase RsmA [Candidatus Omnitrophica bacterium]|nr:16S rRNA (adenine(1518)-N(6)/adenine(1519)-N(6))-dimethyltransferase RsmA [Candidatus Omnitrophota bacterium]
MNKNQQTIIRPKKSLGQHFLKDANTIDKIIRACNLQPSDNVLEIGPGLGALTEKIAPSVKTLYAVEKDRNLYSHLCENISRPNTTFDNQDFLAFNFLRVPSPVKVIGNLPYNISSPIIEKLIENRRRISKIFITVQLEFGKRLDANIGTKDYSALTCAIQYYANAKILFKIKNTCFFPAPKVESCFIQLDFKNDIDLKAKAEKIFLSLVRGAFQQRRKQIKNALASFAKQCNIKELLESLSINPESRAENLSVADFVKISNTLFLKSQNEQTS